MGKALPERGSFFFVLLEQVPDAERGLPVDLVVHSFPGVSYPSHALPPVSGNQGLLRLPLPLAGGSCFEGASGAGGAHADLYCLHFSWSSMVSMTFCPVDDMPMLYPFFSRYPLPSSCTQSFSSSAVTPTVFVMHDRLGKASELVSESNSDMCSMLFSFLLY